MRMIERMGSAATYPGHVDKLQDSQIATQTTWGQVPDVDMEDAARHVIHTYPAGGSTITVMNSLDPATLGQSASSENRGWLDPPAGYGHLAFHGRILA